MAPRDIREEIWDDIEVVVEEDGDTVVIGLSSPSYSKLEADAAHGITLGTEVDRLVEELIRIARTGGFVSDEGGGEYDHLGNNQRARQIGEYLNTLGGLELMLGACLRLYYRLYPSGDRYRAQLEWVWDGIGDWMA